MTRSMHTTPFDPERDLRVERVIAASRSRIWDAWTRPDLLEQWWIPAPMVVRVDRLEVRGGGAFVTRMSEDGETFVPHMDAAFLVAEPLERIVFTNALDGSLRPAAPAPVAMTAELTLTEHPDGTLYSIVARHGDAAARSVHADLGFDEGWGAVTAQLAALVESD